MSAFVFECNDEGPLDCNGLSFHQALHPPAGGCCGFIFIQVLNTTKIPRLSKPFFNTNKQDGKRQNL